MPPTQAFRQARHTHSRAERSPVVHLGWSDSARQSGLRQHVEWLDSTERGDRNGTGTGAVGM